jgi:hypothetical protein
MNYLVVLFKNKQRKKILKKFKTKQKANEYFNSLIDTNIIFDKRVENGLSCSFELGLLEKDSKEFDLYFVKDSLGRQVKVDIDDPDYKLIQVLDYKVEEFIYDINNKTKIDFTKFVKKYLPKTGIKLVSKLNHKIVIQNDDDINLFSLKSELDCERFLNTLNDFLFSQKRSDCIIVPDSSKQQKKYLYSLLETKGFSKSVLYKKSTTFFRG